MKAFSGTLYGALLSYSCTLADPLVGAFGLYAGLCFLGALFCYFLYPETAGLSLEETRQVFADGFGIKRANKLRRDKEAAMILVRERMAGRDA